MNAHESLLYRLLSRLLTIGVLLSITLMLLGYLLLGLRHESGNPTWLPINDVLPHALSGDARGILDLGVLVLFATPVLRVVATIGLFAYERQRQYALIALAVLMLLGVSLLVAVVHG